MVYLNVTNITQDPKIYATSTDLTYGWSQLERERVKSTKTKNRQIAETKTDK